MNVTVSVTQDDIDKGNHYCSACPIARAVTRRLAHGYWAGVESATLSILPPCGSGMRWPDSIKLPSALRDFVRRFDNGLPVEPFNFVVDVPDYCVEEPQANGEAHEP
jgi:hypothetical protein